MRLAPLAVALILAAQSALSHEFWIEPSAYRVAPGTTFTADFRNGERFKGGPLAYFDRRSARLELVHGGVATPLAPRNGDLPALGLTAPDSEGLTVIVHQTAPSNLKYKTWEKFARFAAHKDFPDIEARHRARGLPEAGFFETYTRYAKALIATGSGAGADAATEMETEFVALSNPYHAQFTDKFNALLLYQGAPRADAQVETFERAPDGTVTVTLYRTDADGEVSIPVKPGHVYLLDAVALRPALESDRSVWETHWAALTFAVP